MEDQIKSLEQKLGAQISAQGAQISDLGEQMDRRIKKLEDNMKKFMETFMRQQNKDDNQSRPQSMLERRTTTVPGNSSISRNSIYNPKLEFPKFDGFEVENWIRNCEEYFDLFKISEYQRVDMASLHVTGRAEEWITSYLSNKRFVNWHHFAVDMIGRCRYETCVHVCETNSLLKVASESAMKPDMLTDRVEINGNDVHHVFEEITDPLLRKDIDEYVRSDDVDGTTNEADVKTGEGIDLEEDSVSDDRLLSSVVVYEVEHEVLKEAIDLNNAMENAGAVLIREVASKINDSVGVTVIKVDAAIEPELEDRKLSIVVKSREMHHESMLEALHGDNIAFLIFDPGGSTFNASLLKNRCCLFLSFNNKYWKINSLSDMKSVAHRKMPRTVATSVWRPVSTEANWSIECLVNDQISAHDEAWEANELCSSESREYDEGNSLGRNIMNELEWMENLGHEAHRHNTVVDISCAGTCPVRVSIVQTLVKACGGVLIFHDDFGKAFGVNLQRAFIRAAGFHGLLEVRCSDNKSVTKVIGPGEEGNADNHEYVKNVSSLYIKMLSVEEMQCFALSRETRSEIKSEYVYFQLAIQYSNIYHADVFAAIAGAMMLLCDTTLWTSGFSLDDPNVFAAKSPSESGNNMAKAVIARMALGEMPVLVERSRNEEILDACKGHLVRLFIKECWWKCGCSKQCDNRMGTPVLTSRSFAEEDFVKVDEFFNAAVKLAVKLKDDSKGTKLKDCCNDERRLNGNLVQQYFQCSNIETGVVDLAYIFEQIKLQIGHVETLKEANVPSTGPCICHAIFIEGGIALAAATTVFHGIDPRTSFLICEGLLFVILAWYIAECTGANLSRAQGDEEKMLIWLINIS